MKTQLSYRGLPISQIKTPRAKELPKVKHIDNGFFILTAQIAKKISIDGELPKCGYAKKSKPTEELLKLVQFQVKRDNLPYTPQSKHGWIQKTALSWFEGEPVKKGFVWAILMRE